MRHQIVTRLSCYAILSAIEQDIRAYLISENDISSLSVPKDVSDNAAIRASNDSSAMNFKKEHLTLDVLSNYMDFADLSKLIDSNSSKEAFNSESLRRLSKLINEGVGARNRVCHSRPLEPEDFAYFMDLASNCRDIKSISWDRLNNSINIITNKPEQVMRLEIPDFWNIISSRTIHNLPIPDFDDTGFLGRQRDLRQVKILIDHPTQHTISIVGEGGYGKTSLALKALYDILDNDDKKFDVIVWVSLKNRALSGGGTKEIIGAIESMIGTFRKLGSELGIPGTESRDANSIIEEIAEYMDYFKILIAIDNLETVNSEALRPLILSMKPGSKILMTSRIGMMEMEVRHPLSALDESTAINLARRFAQVLNVKLVYSASEESIKEFVRRLFYSPLLIKWFVSSVSAGLDPNKLIQRDNLNFKEAIAFCFENLYEKLSDNDKSILKILSSIRRPVTRAELIYISTEIGINRNDTDWSISKLSRSSMVKTEKYKISGDQLEVLTYSLTEIATEYIGKQAPPDQATYILVNSAMRRLAGMTEQSMKRKGNRAYFPDMIEVNNKDEAIAAVYLREALNIYSTGSISSALEKTVLAKDIAPHFVSAYIISARIASDSNHFVAEEDYITALQLNPNNPLTMYCYALFLIRYAQNYELASEMAIQATKLDPDSMELKELTAYSLARKGDHEEAARLYEDIVSNLISFSNGFRITVIDRAAEANRRAGEIRGEPEKTFAYLSRAVDIMDLGFNSGKADERLQARFWRVINDLFYLFRFTKDENIVKYLSHICISKREHLDPNGFGRLDKSHEFYHSIREYLGLNSEGDRKFQRSFSEP